MKSFRVEAKLKAGAWPMGVGFRVVAVMAEMRSQDKRGSASKRDVYTNLRGCTSRLAEEALKILEETGELIPAKIEHKNGRGSLVWMRPKDKEEND